MKKFSIAMLSMVLAGSLLLSGCGGNTDTQQNEDSNTDARDRQHGYGGWRRAAHGYQRNLPAV